MRDGEWLAEVLLAELPPPARSRIAALPDLAAILELHLTTATAAWPELDVAPERYARHIAHSLPADGEADLEQALRSLHAADLYLACACAAGCSRAIAELERGYLSGVDGAVRATGAPPAAVEEVRQNMRASLLVGGEDRPPGIALYGGRAQLRSWLRSVAVRQAMRHFRDERGRSTGDADGLEDLPALTGDPGLAHFRTRYAADFRTAMEETIAALEPKQRTLLRQHYLDGVTVDGLAHLHKVHRATAARWVAAARTALFDGTRARLCARLGIDGAEVDSIVRLVRSQIDLSLNRLL